ncbi:MAG: hypothetical protein ACYC36_04935 [Bellilinea sp.]
MKTQLARPLGTKWEKLREKVVRLEEKRVFISRIAGSQQEKDLTFPPNCRGFGRIRHFKRVHPGWIVDPLPIDPAIKALNLERVDEIEAQVFQIGACNWRCWYCYVDDELLAANSLRGDFFTAAELIALYLHEDLRPAIIDLSGGYPDLVPEWTFWIMQELVERGLENATYLWTDDNLSSNFLKKFLNNSQIEYMLQYPTYGRVGCIKGYDEISFEYNTRQNGEIWKDQFDVLSDLIKIGFDVYCYTTFTTPTVNKLHDRMALFVDKLQMIDLNLPLRTIPLEIKLFTPTKSRGDYLAEGISNQYIVAEAWLKELEKRFDMNKLRSNVAYIPLSSR